MAIPLLEAIDIEGKDISADALLTQRELARYLVEDRQAHYHFTVKGNQPTLLQDSARFFQDRNEPDFVEHTPPEHGRIETRKIWATTALNHYLDFPHVAQALHPRRAKQGRLRPRFASSQLRWRSGTRPASTGARTSPWPWLS